DTTLVTAEENARRIVESLRDRGYLR
ncbi:MAG: hypothetical protein JWN02_919, partial [Acidobacteria bacterium]|nr:hypothetical protein [Acidobacteriota bacterium]